MEEGEGGGWWATCLDLSFTSIAIASEAIFFSFTILVDRLFSVCKNTHTNTHTVNCWSSIYSMYLHNFVPFFSRQLLTSLLKFGNQLLQHKHTHTHT